MLTTRSASSQSPQLTPPARYRTSAHWSSCGPSCFASCTQGGSGGDSFNSRADHARSRLHQTQSLLPSEPPEIAQHLHSACPACCTAHTLCAPQRMLCTLWTHRHHPPHLPLHPAPALQQPLPPPAPQQGAEPHLHGSCMGRQRAVFKSQAGCGARHTGPAMLMTPQKEQGAWRGAFSSLVCLPRRPARASQTHAGQHARTQNFP